MAEHTATIAWESTATAVDFAAGRYSREHRWTFDGGITIAGSSSPTVVPLPWSSAAAVDPEEAYIAAIASCHMLSFLYVAMKRGIVVTRYVDRAVGVLTKNEHGVAWVSRVTLDPSISYAADPPSASTLTELHHGAHHACFIANSVKTSIIVTGVD